jgi:hypothetical protein
MARSRSERAIRYGICYCFSSRVIMRKAVNELKKTLAELKFDEEHALRLSKADRLKYFRTVLKSRYIDSGRHRFVYSINGHFVVKVPVLPLHSYINVAEWEKFRKRQKAGTKWPLKAEPAKCRLVEVAETKLLIMERLFNVHTPDAMRVPKHWPSWVYKIDCSQCGETSDGKIVAFDYGSDTTLFR